ncbi:MAG: hypothetical protein EOO14_15565 [Chitinophagaceae bacterium]|nr:MAG: hypothetical protein EOO14_15565 [Chitinophagaceae bacterium]
MERNFVNSDFEHVSKWMLEEGYGFDFFSDRQLQKFTSAGAGIQTTNNTYKTILLPANKLITEPSFQKLLALAKAGATILAYKDMPSDVPGFHKLEERRNSFQQLTAQLSFRDAGNVKKATFGKGAFVVGDDLEALLTAAGVKHEVIAEKGLSFIRRKNSDGKVYFINNRTEKPFYDWVPLRTKAVTVFLFEPMNGDIRGPKYRTNPQGETEVLLQLGPHQSTIVQTYGTTKKGIANSYTREVGSPVELKGDWNVSFLTGGPVLPKNFTTSKLESWTESSEDAQHFSGTAKYTTSFAKPAGTAQAWVLDLGKVHETAEVFLNGRKLATLVGPTFQVTIPSSALKATNTLEVVVANLMANRIIYMDKNNLPWKIFYNTNMPARRAENANGGIFTAAGWKPLPSGILGPVTLTPVNYE